MVAVRDHEGFPSIAVSCVWSGQTFVTPSDVALHRCGTLALQACLGRHPRQALRSRERGSDFEIYFHHRSIWRKL